MERYICTVLEIKKLTRDVVEVELHKPPGFEFAAGQYVGFQMEYTARSYSMVNTPQEHSLRFCIKIIEDGIGSEFVENLKVGDTVEISGPYGRFVLDFNVIPGSDPVSSALDSDLSRMEVNSIHSGDRLKAGMTQKDLLFIATGVGIAPVRSVIFDLLNKSFPNNIKLLFGLRSEQDIFYYDVFEKLADQHQNFSFIPMLSKPQGEWAGQKGTVTDYLKSHTDIIRNQVSFICGSQAMVTDVRDILLRSGRSSGDIKQEIFS